MQSFGSFFNDNKALALTLMLAVGIVAVGILIFLYRLLFGRRLHMTGGRTRQPRLGVVDAFDLDRQRQLVLIRRDNVEHLVMIGGPNDLVIESAFVRMQPNVALPGGREKDASTGMVAPVAPIALPPNHTPVVPALAIDTPAPAPPPGVTKPAPSRSVVPPLDLTDPISSAASDPLADIPAPAPVLAAQAPPPVPAEPAPPPEAQPDAAASPQPRPATPPRFATTFPPRQLGTGALPPRPPLSSLRTPAAAGTIPRPVAPNPRPMSSTPLSRGTSAASLRRDPPAPPVPGPGEPVTPAAAPETRLPQTPPDGVGESAPPRVEPTPGTAPMAPPPAPSLPTTLDTLESLEEEMAKLLGRPAAGADKR